MNHLPPAGLIPQQPPFRFIEDIVRGEPGRFAEASLHLREDNPVFSGHFPGQPIFPGVLMIEQMAQTACWVMAACPDAPPTRRYALVRVGDCEFRQQAVPGDTLIAHAELERHAGKFAFFNCQVSRSGHRIASARLLVATLDATDPGELRS